MRIAATGTGSRTGHRQQASSSDRSPYDVHREQYCVSAASRKPNEGERRERRHQKSRGLTTGAHSMLVPRPAVNAGRCSRRCCGRNGVSSAHAALCSPAALFGGAGAAFAVCVVAPSASGSAQRSRTAHTNPHFLFFSLFHTHTHTHTHIHTHSAASLLTQ